MSHRPPPSPSVLERHTAHTRSQADYSCDDADEREKERQHLKGAAAAKLAEQEAWEKTRGAGSDVLGLLDLSRRFEDRRSSDSGGSSGGNASNGTSSRKSSSASSSHGSSDASRSRRKRLDLTRDVSDILPTLEELQGRKHEPAIVTSADKLLSRGISEYTLLPRILGRGKFSNVFLASKPSGSGGAPQLFAVKHTPLFPHHPLIATRLLREPTLLAELPPHPNLVNVNETIRTPGHFYLVEEYLEGYVTLEALLGIRNERPSSHLPCLPTDVANRVLDQLLSAVHAIHHPLQICHRDIKPENILVHPDTLQLKLLDFGLATHYSKSEPKLTTCCGSPAFHCPEVVTALRNPQGSIRYWGPEVDAWTCGITMLRVLTGVRYPIGASHTSVRSMSTRAQRAVATIRDPELRARVGKLVEANGERRMKYFLELAEAVEREHGEVQRGRKNFKSTTFIPTTPQHKLKLPLVLGPAAEAALKQPVLPSGGTPTASRRTSPEGSRTSSPVLERKGSFTTMRDIYASPAPTLILSNRERQPPQRILSFVKYCLRCAGILYHGWPDTSMSGMQSIPLTPGPWEMQLVDLHEKALSGLHASWATQARPEHGSNGISGISPRGGDEQMQPPPLQSLSPTTPFPPHATRPDRDPFLHVHIFECVLELVEEPSDEEAGQPSLVQTIMSAFTWGKRPANRRALSTPSRPDDSLRSSSKPRAGGMPQPPGQPAEAAASGTGGPSGKSGDIECLRFYMVVRFPRKAALSSSSRRRPGYSRSTSRTADLYADGSRASSVASCDRRGRAFSRATSLENLTHLTALPSDGSGKPGDTIRTSSRRPVADSDSNRTTPTASRAGSPNVTFDAQAEQRTGRSAHRARSALGKGELDDLQQEGQGLMVETSPDVLRGTFAISAAQGLTETTSAPTSRQGSRSPSRSRNGGGRMRSNTANSSSGRSTCDKVLIHVTDERAVAAVRKALSVGGTTEDFLPDAEVEVVEEQPWMSPAVWANGLVLPEDLNEPDTPRRSDQKRRRPSNRRTLSFGGDAASSQRPRSVTSIDEVAHGRKRQQNAEWPTTRDHGSTLTAAKGAKVRSSDEAEQVRGRPLVGRNGAVGASSVPSHLGDDGNAAAQGGGVAQGVPFPSRRGRAPSQLSTMVLHEESPSKASTLTLTRNESPSETEASQGDGNTIPERMPVVESHAQQSGSATEEETDLATRTSELAALSENLDGLDHGSAADLFARLSQQVSAYAKALAQVEDAGEGGKLAEQLDPLSFEAFKALSPVLGLAHPEGRPSSLHDDAARALAVLGKVVSPRELYMAIDLRCNALMQVEAVHHVPACGGQAHTLIWTSVAEVFGLVQLLSIVVPRIQTKRPQSFSSVFALLADLVGTSMRRMVDATSRGAGRTLSHRTVRGCCTLVLAVAEWEARCNGATSSAAGEKDKDKGIFYKPSQEVFAPFLAATSNLLPYLPQDGEMGLAEAHFQRSLPRYAFTRPGDKATKPSQGGDDETAESDATWSQLARTVSQLHIDLASIWTLALQSMDQIGASGGEAAIPSDIDEAVQADRRLKSTLAVGGFVLHVQLLSRRPASPSTSWSASTAETKLEQALPILILALGTEMEQATTSPSPNATTAERESQLASTSLLWLLWCLDGLERDDVPPRKLGEALVLGLSHVLASHMPLSPSPVARHARFKAWQDLLSLHTERDVALRIAREVMEQTVFSQVKAACIGLMRSLVVKGNGEGQSGELKTILDGLFQPPSKDLPQPTMEAGWTELQDYLADEAAVLQEKAGLLYLIVLSSSSLSLKDSIEEAQRNWCRPLMEWSETWIRHFKTTSTDRKEANRREETERELLLLRTALERVPPSSSYRDAVV